MADSGVSPGHQPRFMRTPSQRAAAPGAGDGLGASPAGTGSPPGCAVAGIGRSATVDPASATTTEASMTMVRARRPAPGPTGAVTRVKVASRITPTATNSNTMIPWISGRKAGTTGARANTTEHAMANVTWRRGPQIRRIPSGPRAVRARTANTPAATTSTPPWLTRTEM